MEALKEMKCEACRKGAPTVTDEEKRRHLREIPEWNVTEEEGIPRLVRTFSFADFASALDFANEVGSIAEEEAHHPAILTEWGRVTVSWWTHKIKGLHRNDFIMAAKTDEAFARR